MKKLLILLVLALFVGCDTEQLNGRYNGIKYEGSPHSFDVAKYKGYTIVSKNEDLYSDRDFYTIKNDSILINIVVPNSFRSYYNVGDIIK